MFYLFIYLFLCLYFFQFLFFIGVELFYNVELVSTVQKSEVEFPVLYSRFLLVIYFIHISVYTSIPISQFIAHPHPAFPPLVSIRLFSTSVSLFLPCKPVYLYHFSRFHIYALIYDIFLFLTYFTLYDSL